MTTFSIDIRGMTELQSELSDLLLNGPAAAARTANFIAQSTAQRARALIENSPATGRMYGGHQASAPGEPPAEWTGALINSIRFTKMTDRATSTATAGSTLAYARLLELGGINADNRYVAPRPFLTPAFVAARAQAEKVLKKEFEKLL